MNFKRVGNKEEKKSTHSLNKGNQDKLATQNNTNNRPHSLNKYTVSNNKPT